MTSLRTWAVAGPDGAEGIARAVIDFAAEFFAGPDEDVVHVLEVLEEIDLIQARKAHPTPSELASGVDVVGLDRLEEAYGPPRSIAAAVT
ncbi:hypothetical protein [Streptomyces hirsutus]|uniref:hypothetical protein n=1 Tax=Streptomyces hirsutus TaxID=35620 RepID=UPI0036BF1045